MSLTSPLVRRPRVEILAFTALLTMTAAWGSTFFLIKDVVTRLPAGDLLAVRFGMATIALAAVAGRSLRMTRQTLLRGLFLGVLYGVAQILQTVGLTHTAASVSGFVTGLYVVLTPLLGALILRTRVTATVWIAALLATGGLAVLALRGFSLGHGEAFTALSALIYAGHIIALGRLSEPGTAMPLSVVQLGVITVISAGTALVGSGGKLQWPGSTHDWLVVVYLAVIAGALTMLLQTWAQARVEPARAAVIMSMEPVWAAAFAVALGGESITARMIIGGSAILAAMYLVELGPRGRKPAEPVPEPAEEPIL